MPGNRAVTFQGPMKMEVMPYLREVANTQVISLQNAPAAYKTFSDGSPKKFVIDPHNTLKIAA